jgi:hypothetical protein
VGGEIGKQMGNEQAGRFIGGLDGTAGPGMLARSLVGPQVVPYAAP